MGHVESLDFYPHHAITKHPFPSPLSSSHEATYPHHPVKVSVKATWGAVRRHSYSLWPGRYLWRSRGESELSPCITLQPPPPPLCPRSNKESWPQYQCKLSREPGLLSPSSNEAVFSPLCLPRWDQSQLKQRKDFSKNQSLIIPNMFRFSLTIIHYTKNQENLNWMKKVTSRWQKCSHYLTECKAVIIKVLHRAVTNIEKQTENSLSKEIEDTKNQIKILELVTTVIKTQKLSGKAQQQNRRDRKEFITWKMEQQKLPNVNSKV